MSNDTREIERLLRGTFEATRSTAPSEAGAWHRFETRRRRRAMAVRTGAGLAFTAIVGAAVALSRVVGWNGDGERQVAPATAPVASTPPMNDDLQPAGAPLTVASGTVAGRSWTYQIYRSAGGQLCARWARTGDGTCTGGAFAPSTGVNPFGGEVRGERPLGTAIDGQLPPAAVRVVLRLRGRAPLELRTRGADRFGAAAFATVLPGRVVVERIIGYDANGKVVYDAKAYNTPWPGEPATKP